MSSLFGESETVLGCFLAQRKLLFAANKETKDMTPLLRMNGFLLFRIRKTI